MIPNHLSVVVINLIGRKNKIKPPCMMWSLETKIAQTASYSTSTSVPSGKSSACSPCRVRWGSISERIESLKCVENYLGGMEEAVTP